MIADPPEPPYYAAIFSSQRTGEDGGYAAIAEQMVALAREQPGFLGVESVRGADGFGITVSYWESEAAIEAWKANADHRIAQARGKAEWYAWFCVRIARVERRYGFGVGDCPPASGGTS